MKKKDVLNFAPSGVNRKRKTPRYVILCVVLCIVLFSASVGLILIMNDFDISRALGARQSEENESVSDENESAVSSVSSVGTAAPEYVFLVLCSDNGDLLFSQLVRARPSENEITVQPVSVTRTMKTENGNVTLKEAFATGSLFSLCEAFSRDGIAIDRYVHVTKENYRILLSNLGSVDVEVGEYCEFNVDAVKYTFEEGVRTMTSDMLIKYLEYAGDGQTRAKIQASVTVSVLKQHFTKSNYEKGESFFSSLINSVDSNITAFDYGAAKSVLEAMLSDTVSICAVD